MVRRTAIGLMFVSLVFGTAARAQEGSPSQAAPPSQTSPPAAMTETGETRPATTTWFGDTGLWFVPTAEIVPAKKWSASGYRTNWDYKQGFTDVSHFIGTFGVGVLDRVELFGSWRFDTRIDRDSRGGGDHFGSAYFKADPAAYGGLVNDYPYLSKDWNGDNVGDLVLGVKFSILSEYRRSPVAFAVRAAVKLPTGDSDKGVTTGKADFFGDAIVSKEIGQALELSGFGGLVWRGDSDSPIKVDLTNGLRWGIGAGFPTRRAVRLFTELHGEARIDDALTATGSLTGIDGSRSPLTSKIDPLTIVTVGAVWQHRKGFFAGGGVNYTWPDADPKRFGLFEKNFWGIQGRIGYHPGVRVYVPPPPPPPAPPPPPPAPQPPHNLTVKARCEPCTVDVLKSSTVSADAKDSLGHAITSWKWSAPTGTFANAAQQQTVWTAPNQEGTVPVTVTATCSEGLSASDTVNIQVVRPAVKTYTFEDVHFDFDRYSLRPDATRILTEVVSAMKEDPGLRLEVEGHTCNIGTAEYNLALGERRSNSVRDYLTSQGVTADRLRTVSYGEERPKHDNAREETRRLNRRAALVVRLER